MPTFSFSASQTPIHPPNLAQVCEDSSLSMVESLPPLYYLILTSMKECNSWCCIYLIIWKNMSSILRTGTILTHFDLSLLIVLPIAPYFPFFLWYRLCLDLLTHFSSCNSPIYSCLWYLLSLDLRPTAYCQSKVVKFNEVKVKILPYFSLSNNTQPLNLALAFPDIFQGIYKHVHLYLSIDKHFLHNWN